MLVPHMVVCRLCCMQTLVMAPMLHLSLFNPLARVDVAIWTQSITRDMIHTLVSSAAACTYGYIGGQNGEAAASL